MTVAAAISFPLAVYAGFVLWRIRVEDGWVGFTQPRTPLQLALLRLKWGFANMEFLLGETFRRVVERTAEALAAWNLAARGPE